MKTLSARHARRAGLAAILLLLPLVLQSLGHHWVRVADTSLLYVMLALGLNVVVGYAGLLDLGYVAFYALGAYLFALLTSPHLTDHFAWIAALFPQGLHTPWWVTIPLGAALAIPTKLRLFDWLKRRKECGDPCQLCAKECEIQAIHPDGHINANECHYCLDCQMTWHNENKCPPLINKRKKRNKAAPEQIPVVQINPNA